MPQRLHLALLVPAALACAQVQAQSFPARTVRVVVPYSTGGGTDNLMRAISPRLGEQLGQQVVVDNRPGANGMIGTELVARAAPDGHNLVLSTNALTINPAIYKKVPFDTVKDLTPVTIVASTQNLLAVHPSIPVRSVKELIALARRKPGELAFGSGGTGQPSHMSGELFQQMAGVKMIHVPYKGSGASIVDLISGQISVSFSSTPSLIQHVRTGKLRPLALCGAKRMAALPDLPTIAETLPGYDVVLWFALLGPAGMTRELTARWHGEIAKVTSQADVRQRLEGLGYDVDATAPDAFAAIIRTELARWDKVVKQAGIQPL